MHKITVETEVHAEDGTHVEYTGSDGFIRGAYFHGPGHYGRANDHKEWLTDMLISIDMERDCPENRSEPDYD